MKKKRPGYARPGWAVEQIVRDDKRGVVEDVCVHGIGHPNHAWLRQYRGDQAIGLHGCDGCCADDSLFPPIPDGVKRRIDDE